MEIKAHVIFTFLQIKYLTRRVRNNWLNVAMPLVVETSAVDPSRRYRNFLELIISEFPEIGIIFSIR